MKVPRLVVCGLEELPDGHARGLSLGTAAGIHDAFVVRAGERIVCYRNVCPHAGNPLNWKPHAFLSKKRDFIICSVHGATFDIQTGKCVGGPCPGRGLTPLRAALEAGEIVVYPD